MTPDPRTGVATAATWAGCSTTVQLETHGRIRDAVPMATLLIVHHTPSPTMQELLDAVVEGATTDEIDGVDVTVRPALTCPELEVLDADGYLLGTPANIGYMSGALKHFFDRVYYPCLEATKGRPYGLWVHGSSDTSGAARAVTSIAGGLEWKQATQHLELTGPIDRDAREAAWELGANLAAALMPMH